MPDPHVHDETVRDHVERTASASAEYRVVVVDGPDRGKAIAIGPDEPAPVHVGKSAACALSIADPRVSRRHLALEVVRGALRVVDLGSTNGTIAGGIAIADAFLRGGDELRVGDTTLRIDLVDANARASLWPIDAFGRLLGSSVAMRRVYPLLQKLSASALPVVVEGETGTGKELCAEAIHEMGPRKHAPFIVFDCAAHDAKQLEAILFGEHVGEARSVREGLFEQADGGTLLVDEIAELPLLLQAKLLRVLERGEFSRVRGDGWLRADVRVIATTRQNLEREVERGRFREDLFFRVAAARVELPPLRSRPTDVPILARHFWRRASGERAFPQPLLDAYEDYGWPGNVRELRHVVLRKAALGDVDDQSSSAPAAPVEGGAFIDRLLDLGLGFSETRARVLADFERVYVARVLAKHGGNVSRAAAASGVARRYFQILRTRHDPDRGGT